MIVENFKAEHMFALDLQDDQQYISQYVTPEHAATLELHPAFTGMHDGRVLICAGIMELWPGRALLWSYLDMQAGKHMVAIHRAGLRLLSTYEGARIEADIDAGFKPGHRWIRMLGFELETECMRKYRPDGGACAKYVRIK